MSDPGPSPFAHVLHADVVRRLSDTRSYERGQRYFREGRAAAPVRRGSRIEGRVHGTTDYAVSLWIKGDGLAYSCTCPLSNEGTFCKHCVAVALAWLDANALLEPPRDVLQVIERYLGEQEREDLVRLLVLQAARDPELLARLLSQARAKP
jgi:uncharacterized Zn finger protein